MAVGRVHAPQPRRRHQQHFLRSTRLAADLVRDSGVVESDLVLDLGAGTGVLTAELARRAGRVLAVEPSPQNVAQLEHNIRLNELENVDVHAIALAAAPGEVALQLGADPAFHSTATVVRSRDASATTMVLADTLDGIWRDAGSPHVSFLKVDTEGAELDVLRGGRELLETWRMPILLEAKENERLRALDALLVPLGYKRTRPRAFAVGNYLYTPQVRAAAPATT